MSEQQFDITWEDAGLSPRCKPNPAYPNGIDVDVSNGASAIHSCKVTLPYPAERIGKYLVECKHCGIRVACTTAGRADDPRSIKMACKVKPS